MSETLKFVQYPKPDPNKLYKALHTTNLDKENKYQFVQGSITTSKELEYFNPRLDKIIEYNRKHGLPANTPSMIDEETPNFRQVSRQGNGGKRRKRTTQRRRKRKGGKSKRRRRM